jgi:integrase
MARPRKSGSTLPPYVRQRHGAYHYDRPGVRSCKLCRVDQGLAAMHEALAKVLRDLEEESPVKGMVRLCREWKTLEHHEFGLRRYSQKTRGEYERMLGHIERWFQNFDVHQVKPHHIAQQLDKKFATKPRTHNAYRALLSLLFKWAIRKGLRDTNPCAGTVLATMTEQKRSRYISDAELEIIRRNGDDRLSLFIDLALITGQRVGDLISLTWADVSEKGIVFKPSKVENTTAVVVPVSMTDELRAVLDALKGDVTPLPTAPVVRTQTGGKYSYSGIYSAWRRACLPEDKDKPQVKNAHIHDLRHNAITNADRQGKNAQSLAGHATRQMTEHYIEIIDLEWVEPPRLKA